MSTLLPEFAPATRRPRLRTVRVALAGCGAVGSELVRLLHGSRAEIASRYGLDFQLERVLVRTLSRPRPRELPEGVLTTDVDAFLATEVELVVEAIGGLHPAERIARSALAAGRRLVTANKALVAAHGPELVRAARRSRGRLDFESAVAGGIPVLRALRDQLGPTEIRAVRGVLNGTTNYILTRLAEGVPYAEALRDAQERGFAEADPSRDVGGQDAEDKIRILAWLAFGVAPASLPVRVRGIVPHPDRLAADAAALGGVPRLLAECVRTEQGVTAAVEPAIVRPDSELGQVRGEENLVAIDSRWNGRIRLSGPGAGGAPTASSLLADMLRSAHPLRMPRVAVRGAADAAARRWLLSVQPGAGEILAHVLEQARVQGEEVGGGRILTAPTPWVRVGAATRALEAAGAAPVLARVEV